MIPKNRPQLGMSEIAGALGPGAARSQFEAAVAARAGARYAVAFAYAHAGFFALLKVLELSQAEVILPAYTCDIMPEVVVATGNIPVWADIDLADFNMNLGGLRSALSPRTRIIVATHMFGHPMPVRAVREIAGNPDVMIVEDAALTFPGATAGPDGLQGDVGLFSFGPGKPLFTLRGGVLVTNQAALYEKLVAYRQNQMSRLPRSEWAKRWALLVVHTLLSKGPVFDLAARLRLSKDSFQAAAGDGAAAAGTELPGDYATAYADFQARIGLAQLRRSAEIESRRRAQARLYAALLEGIRGLVPAPLVEGASFTPYTIRVQNRDELDFGARMRARGVETGHTFNYALPALPKYRQYSRGAYPCAEQAGREAVNLPAHTGLSERQSRFIAEQVRGVLRDAA